MSKLGQLHTCASYRPYSPVHRSAHAHTHHESPRYSLCYLEVPRDTCDCHSPRISTMGRLLTPWQWLGAAHDSSRFFEVFWTPGLCWLPTRLPCTQMHFLSFCRVILSSCTLYYVHEEVVAVLSLAVVTKMSYVGFCQSSVDPSPLI